MLDPARPLILVGGGKMGEALLAGWLAPGRAARGRAGGRACRNSTRAPGRRPWRADRSPRRTSCRTGWRPAALLLAVKPQMMDAALPAYARLVAPDTLVLSIAAGKPIALFERVLGARASVVRAMPNTPAAVGRGVTVLCANAAAGPAQRALAERLMACRRRGVTGSTTRS